MSESMDEIERLREEARQLPYGPAKVGLLEEAVRCADLLANVELAYQARHELMVAATATGRLDVTLVAFSWCLAQYDRTPDRFDRDRLLWVYKWVAGSAFQFPQISWVQFDRLCADLERRTLAAGMSLRPIHWLRWWRCILSGNTTSERAAAAKFHRSPRDRFSDCPACEAGGLVACCVFHKQWRRALKAAEPVLQGKVTCQDNALTRVMSTVLQPLLRLGRIDEARLLQRRGYRLVCNADHFVIEQAYHLECAVLLGNLPLAKRMVERHLPAALTTVLLDDRFSFAHAGRLWTERLLQRGTQRIKVRLPAGVQPASDTESTTVARLGDWFLEQAQTIAQQFDARNGTTLYQDHIDDLPKLLRLAVE